jgi:hypothetical protein
MNNTRVPELREQLRLEFESTAEWRYQKAEQYPNDERNVAAADMLQRLARTVDQVRADLMQAYANAFSKNLDSAVETENALMKAVGFGDSFDTAEDFIVQVIDLQPTR